MKPTCPASACRSGGARRVLLSAFGLAGAAAVLAACAPEPAVPLGKHPKMVVSEVDAVVVDPDGALGDDGLRAYPFGSTAAGFEPERDTYRLPYRDDDLPDMEPLDGDRFGYSFVP